MKRKHSKTLENTR